MSRSRPILYTQSNHIENGDLRVFVFVRQFMCFYYYWLVVVAVVALCYIETISNVHGNSKYSPLPFSLLSLSHSLSYHATSLTLPLPLIALLFHWKCNSLNAHLAVLACDVLDTHTHKLQAKRYFQYLLFEIFSSLFVHKLTAIVKTTFDIYFFSSFSFVFSRCRCVLY